MKSAVRSSLSSRHRRLMELLQQARQEAGLTQAELAARLDRPQSYVHKVETGERRIDAIEIIEVTEAIGCGHEEIMRQVKAVHVSRGGPTASGRPGEAGRPRG